MITDEFIDIYETFVLMRPDDTDYDYIMVDAERDKGDTDGTGEKCYN